MDLSKINDMCKINRKETIKLSDLKQDVPVLIKGVKIIDTKYGKAVLVDLGSTEVFLPKRATSAIEECVKEFIPDKYVLIYKGTIECGLLKPALNFEIQEAK